MVNNVWHMLEEEFNEYPTDAGGEVKDIKEITNAEKALAVTFCEAYKKFLQKYGGAMFEGHFVHGLRYVTLMGKSGWSVVDKTRFYKDTQKWPDIDDWYIVSDDGRGNPIGVNPKGEVWLSDHDSGFEQIKLADTFEEFLYKLLTDTLYE